MLSHHEIAHAEFMFAIGNARRAATEVRRCVASLGRAGVAVALLTTEPIASLAIAAGPSLATLAIIAIA